MKIRFNTSVEFDPKNITCRNIETGEQKKLSEIKLEYNINEETNLLSYPWVLPEAEIKDIINKGRILYCCDYSFEE